MTATPNLDILTAEGRRWLAEHWDELAAANPVDTAHVAARQAAEAVARHPWTQGEPDHADPHARLRLLLEAFGELVDVAGSDDGRDGLLAGLDVEAVKIDSALVAPIVEDAHDSRVDAAALMSQLVSVYRAVAAS